MTSTTTFPATQDYKKFFEGSTKHGEFRRFGDNATTMFKEAEDPVLVLVNNEYEKRVAQIKAGTFSPPRVASAKRALIAFTTIFTQRLPLNVIRLDSDHPGEEALRVALIPWVFRSPHPTKQESDAWLLKWQDGGDLHTLFSTMAPGYEFFPSILYGTKPTDAVMISVTIVRA